MTGRIPPGFFAVEDPDQPGRWTFWEVDPIDGAIRDWPQGARWRPLPPPGSSREEKRDFYAPNGPYYAWREQVAEAIAADPAAAAARFRTEHPSPSPLPRRYRRRVATQRPTSSAESRAQAKALRDCQALIVAALRAGDTSYRAISKALGVPLSTAHRRAARGLVLAELAGADMPTSIRRSVVDQFADALAALTGAGRLDEAGEESVRAVAAALLSADKQVPDVALPPMRWALPGGSK